MSNIIPFDSTPAPGGAIAEVPAHLVALFGDSANITPKFNINQLSYRGKTWRRVVDGEEVALTRTTAEGDVEPIPTVSLVILDHNKNRSRAFYEGAFEEGKNSAPTCYSGDGITPDASVKEPCAATCATCPNAVKGSKITENGKQSTLCSPFKRVAVVPSAGIGSHPPMLLRLAQTSVWDKDNGENEAKGWYAYDQFMDMLRARGAKHTAAVETKVKFDLRMAYPKLLFSAARWLNPDEATAAKEVITAKEKEIADILTGGDRDGVAGTPAAAPDEPEIAAAKAAAAVAAAVKAAQASAANKPMPPVAAKPPAPKKPPAAPAPVVTKTVKTIDTAKTEGFSLEQMIEAGWTEEGLVAEGMLVITQEPVTAAKPPAPTKPKGPPKPPAAKADDGGGDAFAAASKPPAPATAPVASAPATVVTDTPAGLADLLSGWDGDDT